MALLTPPHLRRVGRIPGGGGVECGRDDDLRCYVTALHAV